MRAKRKAMKVFRILFFLDPAFLLLDLLCRLSRTRSNIVVGATATAAAIQPRPQQYHRQSQQSQRLSAAGKPRRSSDYGVSIDTAATDAYATYWEELLWTEYRETANELRERLRTWSRSQLERAGLAISDAVATPDSELWGDKIVRITKMNHNNNHQEKILVLPQQHQHKQQQWRHLFARGDVLLLTPKPLRQHQSLRFSASRRRRRNRASTSAASLLPRECLVVDVGSDWMTVGVGPTWPVGLWESRKQQQDSYRVRLDKAAPQAPLRAQRLALDMIRKNQGGAAAQLLVDLWNDPTVAASAATVAATASASERPQGWWPQQRAKDNNNIHDDHNNQSSARTRIQEAMERALQKNPGKFIPNDSQQEAIQWALLRQLALIRGPPGTGKTRVAALLIGTALQLQEEDGVHEDGVNNHTPRRVLAVTHSNGAADVLLEALLDLGILALRWGRPASVSSRWQHRTMHALALSDWDLRVSQEY